MELHKKNLQTVKNKLLLELEDDLLDMTMAQLNAVNMTEEEQEQMAKDSMITIMNTVKDRATRFAQICYTDKDGNELTEESLKEIPLKMKIFKEALPEILEIVMGSLDDGEDKSTGKPKRVTTRRKKS